MANQIKGKIEEAKSDFKVTIFDNFNNFTNKVEARKSEIKFLGQNVFPELHQFLTSDTHKSSISPQKEIETPKPDT